MNEKSMLTKVLYLLLEVRTNAQSIHWNYKGDNFISLHKYMDEVLDITDNSIDRLAEIMRSNNFEVSLNTNYIVDSLEPETMVNTLLNTLEQVTEKCTEFSYLSDIKTVENALDDLVDEFSKITWFINSTF